MVKIRNDVQLVLVINFLYKEGNKDCSMRYLKMILAYKRLPFVGYLALVMARYRSRQAEDFPAEGLIFYDRTIAAFEEAWFR